MSTAVSEGLAAAVMALRPFVDGRRENGELLADYFDGHRVLGDPAVLSALAEALAERIAGLDVDCVAGEAVAGSSLATAVSLALHRGGRGVPVRALRREPKSRGVPGVLSTHAPEGSRFALVDDVAGTGACLERSVRRLRELRHEVVGAWVIVDRQDGAAARLEGLGVRLSALFTLNDFSTARTPLP